MVVRQGRLMFSLTYGHVDQRTGEAHSSVVEQDIYTS